MVYVKRMKFVLVMNVIVYFYEFATISPKKREMFCNLY